MANKYDFRGIKKFGARGLETALSTTAIGKMLFTIPVVRHFLRGGLELAVNWLANQGLVVFNIAAISVEGVWDQKQFDFALDQALEKVRLNDGKLSKEEMAAIDQTVIEAFRRFAIFNRD